MQSRTSGAELLNNRMQIIVFFIITIGCLVYRQLWAADNNIEDPRISLDEIVVTATKVATTVDNIPTNVSVISRKQLERLLGHHTALSALKEANIPGLFFSGNVYGGGSQDVSISTRGSENSNWGMKIMINGIDFNRPDGVIAASRIAVHDIERIEITKTPSAEYGDQAIGGVINIITRAAKEPMEGKAGIAFTSLGGGNGYSVLNGTQDKWEYYIDASVQREDAYQDRVNLDGNNVYTRIGYVLNDSAQLIFHGSYTDTQGIYAESLTRDQLESDPSQNPNTGADYDYESEDTLQALVYQQQLGDHEFMAKIEYQTADYQLFWGYFTHMDSELVHPEMNITFNHDMAGMANKLVVGGEYRNHDYDVHRYTASSFNDLTVLTHDFTRKDVGYACYFQDELQVTDSLTISAGIRYDFFDLEQNSHITGGTSWAQDKGDFSPKIGFTYQICDEVNLFAGYNSGLKSPVKLPVFWTNGNLDPEKLQAYEVGFRGHLGRLNYNFAFFLQTVDDKFVLPSADWTAEYENAGETSSKGFEMGVGTNFPNGIYTSANFTYQDSKFEDFVSMGVDYSGKKVTGVPDILFAFTLGFRNETLGDISLNPVYTGRRYFNFANTNEDEGFWVLNARYTKKIKQIEFFLAANNLLDENAVGSGSGNPGSEMLYPISGINAVLGMNVTF
ncbi:TonB-dependent receptor [uncultured Desulfobacter sp.]|uniref:TonB-dependent receptor n=1 Tax=uncultured Desulfobacter sp. TaxID=240139 RepID=UPI0029F49420|nr:TonB-dependent receptor [uncultured Desulfobacter sp.]